jgi:hypothetical protein
MHLTALRAELTRHDIATAEGIGVKGESPVLGLCRELISKGYDPATPLNVYRGDTLALRIRGIGEGAVLVIAGDGRGFRPRPVTKIDTKAPRQPDTAPLVR